MQVARAAKACMPYGEDELEEIVRDTAIALKLIVVRTGNPYNILTDVSGLVAGFIRRCAEANVFFVAKHCRKLSMQRLINQNPAALKAFSDKTNPRAQGLPGPLDDQADTRRGGQL